MFASQARVSLVELFVFFRFRRDDGLDAVIRARRLLRHARLQRGDLLLQLSHIVSSLLLRGVQLRPQRPRGFARERELILGVARALARLSSFPPAGGRGAIGLQQVERRALGGSAGS